MCGIVGYIGNERAKNILIDGLKALEYRGYDSAGIAVLENNKITVEKSVGRVNNLSNLIDQKEFNGCVGIAHTRWATHGKPSTENSHPHSDNSSTFSVVHNGIIENYNELREFLKAKGYNFLSETDTEVIPNLIHYYYTNFDSPTEDKLLYSIVSAAKDLKGSFAIAVISSLYPDRVVVTRKDSPLVIGTSSESNYIASDIPAILKYTNKFYLLEDNEFAVCFKNSINFYDNNMQIHNKAMKDIEWAANSVDKAGFEDYMLKEIFEQPNSIRETIGSRLPIGSKCSFDDLDISYDYLKNINKIYIVACGTAMHAGLAAKNMFEQLCKIQTIVEIASEFRYRKPLIDKNTLCIYISQSGETADTIAALKLAKNNGAKTLAISNVIGSSITREADYCLYTHAGPEIAVASTKAYTSQIVMLAILSIHFAEILNTSTKDYLEKIKSEILDIPSKVQALLDNKDEVNHFASQVYTEHDMYFLGRGIDYCTALEASLKLKEISYIHSDAYAAGELKHGPIALIENGITVIGIITDEELKEKSLSNFNEVITRGAKTLIITNKLLPQNNFNAVINIPDIIDVLSPILAIIPLQLLSYYISKNKGLDVDKPRNLAKSVTVE